MLLLPYAFPATPPTATQVLAASKEINRQLLEELEPQVRAKIEKNLPADLTKSDKSEILRHF